MSLGTVTTSDLERFVEIVSMLINRLKRRENSSGEKKKGHQKTPACIEAVILDAIDICNEYKEKYYEEIEDILDKILDNGRLPRGGFTDVGRHSAGGQPRETIWPSHKQSLQASWSRINRIRARYQLRR